jgi:polysaccharide biosynthesis/export protein ExoF
MARLINNSVSHGGRSGIQQALSRALRLSLAICVLLLLAPACYAIATTLSEERIGDSLRTFSDRWTRLLASTFSHSGSSPSLGADAKRRDAAERPGPPLAVVDATEHGAIAYGDRLKITFFESLGVALDHSGSTQEHVVATVFPRMDLSAEYAVDESGSINIPKLGEFRTVGLTLTALQSKLADAFKRAIGRTSDVQIAIVDRQPIYVLGAVRNVGTFKHTPGMIVLQALADAGGIDNGMADTSKAIESIRETERLRQEQEKLDRLILKQARLIAQRENSDAIMVPVSIQSRLSETVPQDRLNALVAEANAILSAERKSYQQQLSLAGRQVSIARVEIEAQNLRADQLKTLFAKKVSRLRELEEIAARGSVSRYKVMDMNVDISELVARQEDLHVALAQAERRLAEAEMAQAKIELDHSVGLEKELAATKQDIDDCSLAITSMQAVTQVLRNSLPQTVGGSAATNPSLRITRRLADGFTVIPATAMTSLLPGDVVQVNADNRFEAPMAENAQPLQN